MSYKPSKHLESFHIAGFQHHDGATIFDQLNIGTTLELVAEPDNPYDRNAVALYLNGVMIGYVPKDRNETLSTMLFYGHGNAFEARVIQSDGQADPWNQVLVGLYIADNR